jgi:hypothetical protein
VLAHRHRVPAEHAMFGYVIAMIIAFVGIAAVAVIGFMAALSGGGGW